MPAWGIVELSVRAAAIPWLWVVKRKFVQTLSQHHIFSACCVSISFPSCTKSSNTNDILIFLFRMDIKFGIGWSKKKKSTHAYQAKWVGLCIKVTKCENFYHCSSFVIICLLISFLLEETNIFNIKYKLESKVHSGNWNYYYSLKNVVIFVKLQLFITGLHVQRCLFWWWL